MPPGIFQGAGYSSAVDTNFFAQFCLANCATVIIRTPTGLLQGNNNPGQGWLEAAESSD